MDDDDYTKRMLKLLENKNICKEIRRYPTNKLQRKITNKL